MASKENSLPERILQAEAGEMDAVIHALRTRYKELHPDRELVVAAIPKDDKEERAAFWEWLIRYVRNYE